MHISDGILSTPVAAAGFIGTAIVLAATTRRLDHAEMPKLAVISSAFFVADLIHVPVGISSVHLILNGLAGVMLGWRAFLALVPAIILQSILFQHGGITAIGVNCLMLGGGALVAYGVWQLRHRFTIKNKEFIFGALAGASATFSSGIIFATAMLLTGGQFWLMAMQVIAVHLIVMLLEAGVVGSSAAYIYRIKPEILAGYRPPPLEKLRASA